MAGHEAPHADIYDPVRLTPEGSLFDRIFLEKLWNKEHGDGQNPDNGEPFNISDIQPQTELRNQLRQGVVDQVECYPSLVDQVENSLEQWKVIPDYPFHFLDEDHMRDYVNLLSRSIAEGYNVGASWKSMNLLRLNCQYSHANTALFRSVNGFETLIGALDKHFDCMGPSYLSYDESDHIVGMEEIVNLCREIVMLLEILGWSTDTPTLSHALCGIMRFLYLEGGYKKDKSRIVRFIDARLYDIMRLPLFNYYFDFAYHQMEDPVALSSELSLCADVTNRLLLSNNGFHPRFIYPLSRAMGTLVSRFCDDDMNNMVNEDYGDLSAALENVMKVMCRLGAKCGLRTDSYIVVGHIRKILRHVLLPPGPGARLFKGRHLLFALLLSKYIFADPRVNSIEARVEDVKIVFDFAMSDLTTRYLFNGRPRLKDLADEVVSVILTRHPSLAEIVLSRWPDLHS